MVNRRCVRDSLFLEERSPFLCVSVLFGGTASSLIDRPCGRGSLLGDTSLFCVCVCRFCWEERRPLWSTADVPAARFLEEHYQEFREELDVLLSVEGSFDQFHNVLPPPVDKQRCLETTAPKIPCSAAYKMGLWVALLTN